MPSVAEAIVRIAREMAIAFVAKRSPTPDERRDRGVAIGMTTSEPALTSALTKCDHHADVIAVIAGVANQQPAAYKSSSAVSDASPARFGSRIIRAMQSSRHPRPGG
jgi:hypothetical protein